MRKKEKKIENRKKKKKKNSKYKEQKHIYLKSARSF